MVSGIKKSSLKLKQELRYPHGKRFALLVNDFGSIHIDAELLESRDGDTINRWKLVQLTLGGWEVAVTPRLDWLKKSIRLRFNK